MPLPDPIDALRPDLSDTAFLFDLDGTLLEIALLPGDVVVPPRLLPALTTLRRLSGGAVGIVSGRRIAFLEKLLPDLDVPLAGVHGLEIRLGGKGSALISETGGGAGLVGVREKLGPWLKRRPGLTVEDKGLAVAIHFRSRPELAEDVAAFAAANAGAGLRVQHGKMVVEMRAAGPSKGDAVTAMMALPAFAGRRPLFFGDDVTDEDAFEIAAAMGGGGIFVGELSRPTLAASQLPSPRAVLALIETLIGGATIDAASEVAA